MVIIYWHLPTQIVILEIYAYGIVSSARWVYLSTSLRNLSQAFR